MLTLMTLMTLRTLEKHISRAMGNALKIPIVAAGKVAREGKGKAAVTGGLTHISG